MSAAAEMKRPHRRDKAGWAAWRERQARRAREKRMINDFRPPEGVVLNFQVAGLGARFGAQFLDLLLTSLLIFGIMILLAVLEIGSWEFLSALGALLFFFIRAPYYIITELLWNGQTLGKRISKLRVVSADGRTLQPYAVAVRNLMKEMEVFVPGTALFAIAGLGFFEAIILLIWIAILLAVPLTNHKRQRLGDMIAGTYVIYQPKAVLMPDIATRAPVAQEDRFTFLPHQLDHYGAFELQTLERVLQVDTSDYSTPMRDRHRRNVAAIVEKIRAKIEYTDRIEQGDREAFLQAFYRAQRRYLETRQLFGDAREDKFHQLDQKEKAP